jgi:hypothetical protein
MKGEAAMENEKQHEQKESQDKDMDLLVEIEDLRAIVGGNEKAEAKKAAAAPSSMCPW